MPPFVAVNDRFTLAVGGDTTEAAPGVLANDISVSSCTGGVTITVDQQPAFGSLTLNNDGSFTYTPNTPADPDSDSFTYTAVCLPSGLTSTATVTLAGTACSAPQTCGASP